MTTRKPSDNDALLHDLADAISEGRDLDWEAIANSAPEAQKPLVQKLQAIARVSSVQNDFRRIAGLPWQESLTFRSDSLPARWGHLVVIEKIGQGAFGEVFRAKDPRLDREVALKLYHSWWVNPARQLSRIIEEGRLLAHVHHPNVVTIHGAVHHKGRAGIWMELIDGATLKEILAAQGPLHPDEAMEIARDVCRALAAIHGSDVIHRDVKASNVMREAGGRIVLMDLGVSCEIDQRESVRLYGTPLCVAPEVLLRNETTLQGDLYSVGVLLFQMVTGQYPVSGSTLDEVIAAHKNRLVRSLNDLRPDLPEPLVKIVQKALSFDLAERFASAQQFEREISRILEIRSTVQEIQSSSIPSVAVLPFEDISPQQNQEYFCDGLAEGIISNLSHLQGLRVVAHSSSLAFKGKTQNTHQIGKLLNVGAVLRGSVDKSGNQFRISARLSSVTGGHKLWSKEFACTIEDVFAVTGDISLAIMDYLKVGSSSAEKDRIRQARTGNVEAYNLYLKARLLYSTGNISDYKKAFRFFEHAAAKDPLHPRYQVGLAECYLLAGMFEIAPSEPCFAKGKAAAKRAVELDASHGRAHGFLTFYHLLDWDWDAAERSAHQAIALAPQSDTGHYSYAHYLATVGKLPEAISEMKNAAEIDPLSLPTLSWLGVFYLRAGKLEKARKALRFVLETLPEAPASRLVFSQTYILDADFETGLTELQKTVNSWNHPITLAALGWAYAISGRKPEAREILADLKKRRAREYLRPFLLAKLHAGLGEVDQAFRWLEKAVQERDPSLLNVKTDETIDCLRSDPRYGGILRQMNLEN